RSEFRVSMRELGTVRTHNNEVQILLVGLGVFGHRLAVTVEDLETQLSSDSNRIRCVHRAELESSRVERDPARGRSLVASIHPCMPAIGGRNSRSHNRIGHDCPRNERSSRKYPDQAEAVETQTYRYPHQL